MKFYIKIIRNCVGKRFSFLESKMTLRKNIRKNNSTKRKMNLEQA